MQRSFSTIHNSADFGRLRGESEKIPQRSFSPTYRNSGKNMANKIEKERPISLPTHSTSPNPSKSSSNVAYNMEIEKPKIQKLTKKPKKKYSKYFSEKRVGSYEKRVEENQTEKLHRNFRQKIPSDYTGFPEAYGAYIGSPRAMCYSEFIRNPFIVESMGSFIVGPRGSCIIDRDGPMGFDFNVPLFSRLPRVSNTMDSKFPFYGNNGYSRVNIPAETPGIFFNSREEPTVFSNVLEKQIEKSIDEKQEKSLPLYNTNPPKMNAEHQIKGENKFKESDITPQPKDVYSEESKWNPWKILVIISFILILILIKLR